MGYTTIAYGVDLSWLVAVKGSRDQRLLDEMAQVFRKEFEEAQSDSSLTLQGTLERIISDEVEPVPNGNHQYVYALELLCRHLGMSLDCGHIQFLGDLGWEIAMEDSRTPLGLPETFSFPNACYLTADEVRVEYERFRDVDPEDDDEPYLAEAREEYVGWLKECADEGLGLVTFCY